MFCSRCDAASSWRNRFCPAALLCLLAVLSQCALIAASEEKTKPQTTEKSKPQAGEKPKPKSIAVFEFNSSVTDKPTPDDPLFGSLGSESLRSLLTRLKKAGDDDNVTAVALILNSTELDTAQIEEVRQALKSLKEKKPVYAHADSLTTGSYMLLCGASRISVSPTGDVWVNGLYGEELYLRGLFDMIGVQPDFLTCGAYKSAAEMFTRREASPEAAEMHNWLFDSLYASIQKLIADGRGVDQEQVRRWIDQGLFSAETAKAAGMIDAVESREQLLAYLKQEHGESIKLDKKFGKKTAPTIDPNNPFAAFQLLGEILSGPKPTRSTKNAVAVVHVDGPIMLGKPEASLFGAVEGAFSEEIRAALGKVADDPRIRAVVLRVNSPGGSATASEIILQAVRSVQEKKPVVVSMGSVAGSGGYYVSCRGNRIFSDATTLTGSIGVVAGKLATSQMWDKIGINFDSIERGQRAGLLRKPEPWTEEDRAEVQHWMDDVYGVFKQHVEQGREGKLKKPIDELAGGRVFTGEQAVELGLVDQIGTLEDAIKFVAREAQLDDYEVRTFPEARNFFEQLAAEIGKDKEEDSKRLSTGLWTAIEPLLRGIDPERVRMVQSALLQLDFLRRERVMLTMPVLGVRN